MHSFFRRAADAAPSSALDAPSAAATKDYTVRFTNCRLLRDHVLHEGEDLWCRGGFIVSPKKLFWDKTEADEVVDCGGRILAPGYIDLQINGGWGVDFSTPSPDFADGVQRIARQLLTHGVTSFLPTVITSSPSAYRAVLPELVPTKGSVDGAALLGVHLEGPFIAATKPGCHPPEHIAHIATLDSEGGALRRACGEHLAHIRLVTLAPELPGAHTLVNELLADGVVVAAGHSEATSAQIEAALRWGVGMVTHMFNAMPPFEPREPGIVGLLGSTYQPAPYLGLISDGVHVHPSSVKIAAAARPDSIVLVSDGIVAMGLPDGEHQFGDVHIRCCGERAYREGSDTLAGAVVTLDECVRRYKKYADCSSVAALEAASLHAAQSLGLQSSKGSLHLGADADLILLDDDLTVHATYVGGVRAWSADAGAAKRCKPCGAPNGTGAIDAVTSPAKGGGDAEEAAGARQPSAQLERMLGSGNRPDARGKPKQR